MKYRFFEIISRVEISSMSVKVLFLASFVSAISQLQMISDSSKSLLQLHQSPACPVSLTVNEVLGGCCASGYFSLGTTTGTFLETAGTCNDAMPALLDANCPTLNTDVGAQIIFCGGFSYFARPI